MFPLLHLTWEGGLAFTCQLNLLWKFKMVSFTSHVECGLYCLHLLKTFHVPSSPNAVQGGLCICWGLMLFHLPLHLHFVETSFIAYWIWFKRLPIALLEFIKNLSQQSRFTYAKSICCYFLMSFQPPHSSHTAARTLKEFWNLEFGTTPCNWNSKVFICQPKKNHKVP